MTPAAAWAVVFWGVSSKTPVRDALCRMPETFADRNVLLRRASRRPKTSDFERAKTCRGARRCLKALVSVPSLGEGPVRALQSKNWCVGCSWPCVRVFLVSKTTQKDTKITIFSKFSPKSVYPRAGVMRPD